MAFRKTVTLGTVNPSVNNYREFVDIAEMAREKRDFYITEMTFVGAETKQTVKGPMKFGPRYLCTLDVVEDDGELSEVSLTLGANPFRDAMFAAFENAKAAGESIQIGPMYFLKSKTGGDRAAWLTVPSDKKRKRRAKGDSDATDAPESMEGVEGSQTPTDDGFDDSRASQAAREVSQVDGVKSAVVRSASRPGRKA